MGAERGKGVWCDQAMHERIAFVIGDPDEVIAFLIGMCPDPPEDLRERPLMARLTIELLYVKCPYRLMEAHGRSQIEKWTDKSPACKGGARCKRQTHDNILLHSSGIDQGSSGDHPILRSHDDLRVANGEADRSIERITRGAVAVESSNFVGPVCAKIRSAVIKAFGDHHRDPEIRQGRE